MPGEFGTGSAAETNSRSPHLVRQIHRTEDIRRPAAGCNAADYVVGRKASGSQVACPTCRIILAGFSSAGQRGFSAGHNTLHHVGGNVESRRAFRSVQNPEASAGTGAYIEKTPTGPERGDNGIHRAGDGAEFRRNGFGHQAVLGIDDRQHLLRSQLINAGGGGVGLFGDKAANAGGVWRAYAVIVGPGIGAR